MGLQLILAFIRVCSVFFNADERPQMRRFALECGIVLVATVTVTALVSCLLFR